MSTLASGPGLLPAPVQVNAATRFLGLSRMTGSPIDQSTVVRVPVAVTVTPPAVGVAVSGRGNVGFAGRPLHFVDNSRQARGKRPHRGASRIADGLPIDPPACEDEPVTVLFQIFAILAGLVHVLIFVMESVLFARPQVYSRFGINSEADAKVVGPTVLNQGYYNLFLAVGAIGGAVIVGSSRDTIGRTLAVFCCASMVAAALVLVISTPKMARAAVVQAATPLLAIAFALL